MKKVLALVLAVMMVSTTAFAAYKQYSIAPSSSVAFDEGGFVKSTPGLAEVIVGGTGTNAATLRYVENGSGVLYNTYLEQTIEFEGSSIPNNGVTSVTVRDSGWYMDKYEDKVGQLEAEIANLEAQIKDLANKLLEAEDANTEKAIQQKKATLETNLANAKQALEALDVPAAGGLGTDAANNNLGNIQTLDDMIFRSVTNENYTVTSLKVVTGKAYVAGVSISDADEQVKVSFVKDLNNTTPKDFDLSFTLKGKGKMIIRSQAELDKYNDMVGNSTKDVKDTATIPSVKFKMSGKVSYGKVTVDLGTYTDEDLDGLQDRPIDVGGGKAIDLDADVIKFTYGGEFGEVTRTAGSYVADAILTEDYDEGLTMEARVYSGDTLYLGVDNEPDELVNLLDTGDGDVDFYFFHENTKFTTLNTNARLIFNDTEEGDHVYSYKNGKLTEIGEYDEDEGCIVVRARTLGQYIVSDIALDWLDIATSDDVENPDTGANDVVGIAAALAAVALVSAAAVTLKK